jgi:hypothetical protein
VKNVRGFVAFSLTSIAAGCLAQPAQQSIPPKIVAQLKQQIGIDDALPDESNPSGLHLRFARFAENDSDQGHFAVYRAYVLGASEKLKYTLAMFKIGQPAQILPGDVYVNAKGLLMANKPQPSQENEDFVDSDDEVDFAIQAARGEPVRFVLATPDGKTLIPGTVVPYPIVSEDHGCRLEMRLALPEGIAVLIYADGLPPNSEIPFQSISEGESHPGVLHTNSAGHAATIDLLYVAGKDMGTLKVTLNTRGCATSVEVPWGKGTYQPM